MYAYIACVYVYVPTQSKRHAAKAANSIPPQKLSDSSLFIATGLIFFNVML